MAIVVKVIPVAIGFFKFTYCIAAICIEIIIIISCFFNAIVNHMTIVVEVVLLTIDCLECIHGLSAIFVEVMGVAIIQLNHAIVKSTSLIVKVVPLTVYFFVLANH